MKRSLVWALPVLVLAACGDDENGHTHDSGMAGHGEHDAAVVQPPDGYEDPVVGTVREGSQGLYRAELLDLSSSPPTKGFSTWRVAVSAIEDGAPWEADADRLYVVPFMPTHGHGTNTVPEVEAVGDGEYVISRIDLYMSHLWTVTLRICEGAPCTRTGPTLDTIQFEAWIP